LLKRFKPLAFSTASACNTVGHEPSHVLMAMGLTKEQAFRSLRFSFGRMTSKTDVDFATTLIREQYVGSEL